MTTPALAHSHGIPPDLAGIPIVATLPATVTARALELLRMYRTLAAGSTCDRESIAKACVRLACSEHVLPLDTAKDLLVKSKKQTLAFNHALSSLRQRVPSAKPLAATGSRAAGAGAGGLSASDMPSLAMILIKLGAITVDVSFAQQLADKMVAVMRREGEVTGNTPQYWVERLKLEFQCAAVYVQMKEQKSQVSLAKFAKALDMAAKKFDAVVARLQREVKDELEARFRPRTPTKRKRARELLGGGEGPDEEEPEDELVGPATRRQPPLLSATRPLSNTLAARKRARTACPADVPECELTATGQRLTRSSASALSVLGRPGSLSTTKQTHDQSTPVPVAAAAARTPGATHAIRRSKPTPSSSLSTLSPDLALPLPPLPPPPAPPVEKQPSARARLGVGFFSMIPMTHPCKSQRFNEYLDWCEAMEEKLMAAIREAQRPRPSKARKGRTMSEEDEEEAEVDG